MPTSEYDTDNSEDPTSPPQVVERYPSIFKEAKKLDEEVVSSSRQSMSRSRRKIKTPPPQTKGDQTPNIM